MKRRTMLQISVIALIFLFVGVAAAAAVFAYIPDPGSPPAIFDDFQWSSTANGFWHVNPIGGSATIKNSTLRIKGDTVELDHRLQTDPYETVIVAKVRGWRFHKFGLGIGVYHAGTVGLEFDNDGVKCGRGSDFGWKINFISPWTQPPVGKWFYLQISVRNPYPRTEDLTRAENLFETKKIKLKPVTLTCSIYDLAGHKLLSLTPTHPPPNAHYVGFDEVFMRTWDGGNDYQIDWFYAGPLSGSPVRSLIR